MLRQKRLRSIHIASTVWFMLCVGYIFVLGLRQTGVNWWVVFSLSGHGALVTFILISLYLFAIFRGISSSQKVQLEHPLTSSIYYAVFYVITPFLGTAASCLGMIGVSTSKQYYLGLTMGTLGTTFMVWVIIDPGIGLIEMLLPESRKHRAIRLAKAKEERERKQKYREHLLIQIQEKEDSNRQNWQAILKPHAEELADLLLSPNRDFQKAERNAAGLGACAWQIGGINCMRELRTMAINICKQKNNNQDVVDYINYWWDGIGNWRAPSLSA